ncbi:tripartite tricarboxylate transporter TctB family protein [Microbacterium sp. JZ37]|uniref:tripartite tricarboxylate transporter TctB family protein n=1 Tax=Microbacterium sp. JZ37 TaxID=2654193 RepID=UPI002B47FC12|nr:tripartite tricarboxylate transporter TctB family protein [Microbacterium sp. JZ37]WRH18170.1 tripartite tricarboxylate transporter TctB family protein [Microbacterium sp. JZ37]
MAGLFAQPAPPPGDTTPVPIDDSPPAAGPIANLAGSLVAAAVGALGAVLATSLGIGTLAKPGPGLWPLAVSAVVVILALAQLVAGRHGGDGEKFMRASWMAAAGFASLVAYVALLPVIGFEIPTLLLAFLWLRVLGHERWILSIVGSVLIVVGFYLVFVVALKTSIPHLL